MDLRQLSIFRMAATTLNFTQTALALGYVQSNVTAQIKSLEDELGVPLFNRLGRQVALTEAGERLLTYAEQLLSLAEEARQIVSSQGEVVGTLSITAPETICTYYLPRLLREYRDSFPDVKIILQPLPSHEILDAVRNGVVDVGYMIGERVESRQLEVTLLVEDPLVVFAAPSHPLARQGEFCPADFDGETFLVTERTCAYRQMFERRLAQDGIFPFMRLEFHSVEAIKQCTIAGLGLGVLPQVVVEKQVAQGELVILDFPAMPILNTTMFWHKEKWLSPAVSAYLELHEEIFHVKAL